MDLNSNKEYGKIFYLKNPLKGPWIKKAISQMSQLYFYSDNIIQITPIKKYQASKLGLELSDFLYRSYIERIKTDKNGSTYIDRKNIILDYCGGHITNKVFFTEESYEAIGIILNHPVFYKCYTTQDFLKIIPTIPMID